MGGARSFGYGHRAGPSGRSGAVLPAVLPNRYHSKAARGVDAMMTLRAGKGAGLVRCVRATLLFAAVGFSMASAASAGGVGGFAGGGPQDGPGHTAQGPLKAQEWDAGEFPCIACPACPTDPGR